MQSPEERKTSSGERKARKRKLDELNNKEHDGNEPSCKRQRCDENSDEEQAQDDAEIIWISGQESENSEEAGDGASTSENDEFESSEDAEECVEYSYYNFQQGCRN